MSGFYEVALPVPFCVFVAVGMGARPARFTSRSRADWRGASSWCVAILFWCPVSKLDGNLVAKKVVRYDCVLIAHVYVFQVSELLMSNFSGTFA